MDFYGHKVLESQFFIYSNVFAISKFENSFFDSSYKSLPIQFLKVDLTKCLKDKKLSTFLTSYLFPAIEETWKLRVQKKMELELFGEVNSLKQKLVFMSEEREKLVFRQDSLNRVLGILNSEFKLSHSRINRFFDTKRKFDIGFSVNQFVFTSGLTRPIPFLGINASYHLSSKLSVFACFTKLNSTTEFKLPDFSYELSGTHQGIKSHVCVSDFSERNNINSSVLKVGLRYDVTTFFNLKWHKSKLLLGLDAGIIFNSDYRYENLSGVFSYYGTTDVLSEEIHSISELGFEDNVSYQGVKGGGKIQNSYFLASAIDYFYSLGNSERCKLFLECALNFNLVNGISNNFDQATHVSSNLGNYNSILLTDRSLLPKQPPLFFSCGVQFTLN